MNLEYCFNCNTRCFKRESLDYLSIDDAPAKLISDAFTKVLLSQDIHLEDCLENLNLCYSCIEPLSQYCQSKQLFLTLSKPNSRISDVFRIKCISVANYSQDFTANIPEQDITQDHKIIPYFNFNEDETIVPDKKDNYDRGFAEQIAVASPIDYKEQFLCLKVEKLSKFNERFSTQNNLPQDTTDNGQQHTNIYKCLKCSRLFHESHQLKNHNDYAHLSIKPNFSCNFCSQKFSTIWFFKNHLKACHNGIEVVHACKICSDKFYNQKHLKEHLLKQHDIRKYAFKCKNCYESFAVIHDLRSHLVDNHKGTIEADIAENNIKTTEERKLKDKKCSICEEVFPCLRERLKHAKYEHGHEEELNCDMCPKAFKSYDKFLLHRKLHKKCPICGKSFAKYQQMKIHHDNVHETPVNLPYGCEMCGQKYSQYVRLSNHYSWHVEINGPKHCCNICNKTFKLKGHLTLHVKHVHSGNLEKHKCPFCTQVFTIKTNLNFHILEKHKPDLQYPCNICGKKFLTQDGVSRHKRIHTQETKFCSEKTKEIKSDKIIDGKVEVMSCYSSETFLFTCPSCGKSSDSQTHFFRHLRLVHELKGYADQKVKVSSTVACEICDKKFARKDLMDKHRRRAHHLTYKSPGVAVVAKSYHCSHCKKTIDNCTFQSFMAHVKRHEIFIVENVNDNPTIKKELTEFYDEESGKFTCTVCRFSYNKQSKFLEHLAKKSHSMTKTIYDYEKTNDLELAYKCKECPGMAYPTEELLRRHKESHRFRKGRMQTCNVCHIILRSPKYLKIHMQTHS